MRDRRQLLSLALLLFVTSACSRQAPRFSLENARAHVAMLAGTIGSRPIGSPENVRARQYVIDQLRLYGFEVRVQEIDARRPDVGITARVSNIVAVKAGSERGAIALVSHYDSAPEAPGAADDGLGVAVSIEAARVLAARTDARHTLFVLVTDGEESGLMGAAGSVDAETFSGDITVKLAQAAGGHVDFDSFSGSLHSDVPMLYRSGSRRRIQGDIGSGANDYRFKTFSGDVSIR